MTADPARVWLRRGTGAAAGLALVVFASAMIALQHRWFREADWGLRYLAATAYIIAPLLAAACANDIARRAAPTLVELSRTTSHRARLWLGLVLSVWTWSLCAAALAAAVVLTIVAANHGVPPRDPWLALESASIFLAASMVGLVMGQFVSGVFAPVLAAVAVFGSANVLSSWGVPLFKTGVTSGTLVGLERSNLNASLVVAEHLVLVVVCAAWSWWWSGPRPVRGLVAKLSIGGALLAVAAGVAAVWSEPDEFVPTSERYVCVGDRPALCGPVRVKGVLRSAQQGFARAEAKLHGRGLELTQTVVVLRGAAVQQRASEGTPFALHPSRVHDGSIHNGDVAAVLAAPRACAALFSDTEFGPYLADIDLVQR